MLRAGALLAAVIFLFDVARANEPPPIEAYGTLPTLRSMAVSPSGDRVAFFRNEGDAEYAVVYSITEQDFIAAVDIGKIKARSIYFVTEDYVILSASETTRVFGFRGKFEYSAAFSWNLKKGKIKQLLRGEEDLFPAQTGLGRVVGRMKDDNYVFMPAFIGSAASDPYYNLLRVDLDSGRARRHERGRPETEDWLVADDGEVIAREDYDEDDNLYSIWWYDDGDATKIFEEEVEIPRMSLIGVKPDRSALIVSMRRQSGDRDVIVAMTPDGKLSTPLFFKPDADVEDVLTDSNRVVYGVEYSGLTPSYEFFDDRLTKLVGQLQPLFPLAAISVSDWTDDFSNIIVRVAGGQKAPAFYLFRPDDGNLMQIGAIFRDIPDDHIGQVFTVEFKARDGTPIPTILTLPPGAEMGEKRPAVIMPHGGPASYDGVGFDWMAQYFANRGYVVVQPNFRGSWGFGRAFEAAGYGEWGRGVMQHDVSDAVKAMIASDVIDPERSCIVGASYGGYAALAGGAFTPALYKCVAAIAPVTDLPRMIYDERSDRGSESWVVAYWTNVIGDVKAEREKLESTSPANYAEDFTAPVLLIHGNDDTVVPYRQSAIMERALKRADKEVELVKLKGGDHWLSTSETRLETMKALDRFIARHIGPEMAVASAP